VQVRDPNGDADQPQRNMITSLTLNIDFAATPITGTLQDEHGRQHEFVGWLGLSDLLRRIGDEQSPLPPIVGVDDGAEPHTSR
jgi:hypothetical protein